MLHISPDKSVFGLVEAADTGIALGIAHVIMVVRGRGHSTFSAFQLNIGKIDYRLFV